MDLYGYRREDGNVGFRNHILVIPSVSCANRVAKGIAEQIEGAVSVQTQSGCALVGDDRELFKRTLVGYATNPNVAGVLVVGLGCETFSAESIAEEISKTRDLVDWIEIQQSGGSSKSIEKGCEKVSELIIRSAKYKREKVDLNELILGLQCGGSDPASGITANAALGVATEKIVNNGGTAIMAETPEAIGAEHILAEQAATPEVKEKIVSIVKRYEDNMKSIGLNLSEGQPARGNKEAGLTTIEEKSLGCINKLGTAPLQEVLEYAEKPSQKGGIFMDTPGFDNYSLTGLVAGGIQVMVFTTGKGSPCGTHIVPVIKVSSNTELFEKMKDNMDINAGTIIEGKEDKNIVGKKIYEKIIDVANGEKTKPEINKESLFGIWRKLPSV